jgi:hypothetical protein
MQVPGPRDKPGHIQLVRGGERREAEAWASEEAVHLISLQQEENMKQLLVLGLAKARVGNSRFRGPKLQDKLGAGVLGARGLGWSEVAFRFRGPSFGRKQIYSGCWG